MKRHTILPKMRFKKHLVVGRPSDLSSISFDDLHEQISEDWQTKSRQLQARRWRRIRHQTA